MSHDRLTLDDLEEMRWMYGSLAISAVQFWAPFLGEVYI